MRVMTEPKSRLPDKRYAVGLEHCGHTKMRWVVRFCGDWIGSSDTRDVANEIARTHRVARVPNPPKETNP